MPGSERTIKTILALDGEKSFKDAIAGINKDMKVMSSELKNATAGLDKQSDAYKIAATTAENLKGKIDLQNRKIKETKNALDEAISAYGEADSRTKDYKIQLNNAEAALKSMESELKDQESAMKDLDSATNKAGNEISDYGDKAQTAERKTDDMGSSADKLSAIMAGSVVSGIGAAINIISQVASVAGECVQAINEVVKAGMELAKESGDWADELITLSTKTGVSTNTLQKWTYAARFVDTEVETMTKGLSKVVKATGEAAGAGDDYIAITDDLKVAIKDSNGNLRDSEDIFYDVIDAIGKLDNATQKEIASQEIFGKSYQDMTPLIKAGSSALKEFGAEAEKNGSILSDDQVAKLGEYDDTLEQFDAQLEALKKTLILSFIPTLEEGATKLSGFMEQMDSILSDGWQPEDAEALSKLLSDMFRSAADWLNKNTPLMVSILSDLINALLPPLVEVSVDVMVRNFPRFKMLGYRTLGQVILGVGQGVVELNKTVADIVDSTAKEFREIDWSRFGKDMIDGFVSGIKSKISKVGEAARGVASKVKNFLHFSRPDEGPLREYEEWMPDMINGLARGIRENAGALYSEVESLADGISLPLAVAGKYSLMNVGGSSGFSSGSSTDNSQHTTYNITVTGGIPASDTDKRKLAQLIEEARRDAKMAKGLVPA